MSETTRNRTSPYAAFEEEIATTIIKPKIKALFENGAKPITSLSGLITAFKEEYDANVSTPTMKKWLEASGIKLQRSVMFTGVDE